MGAKVWVKTDDVLKTANAFIEGFESPEYQQKVYEYWEMDLKLDEVCRQRRFISGGFSGYGHSYHGALLENSNLCQEAQKLVELCQQSSDGQVLIDAATSTIIKELKRYSDKNFLLSGIQSLLDQQTHAYNSHIHWIESNKTTTEDFDTMANKNVSFKEQLEDVSENLGDVSARNTTFLSFGLLFIVLCFIFVISGS